MYSFQTEQTKKNACQVEDSVEHIIMHRQKTEISHT